MAASVLDGEKICEVSGLVKWSSLERFSKDFQAGSIALYKLSNSYYVHATTGSKRAKFPLKARNGKIDLSTRDSKLILSVKQDTTKKSGSSDVSIHLKDAVPNQLQCFVDSLNGVEAYHASFKGKLSSMSSRENDIQDIENKPCNSINSNVSSTRLHKYESPLRSKLVPTLSPLSPKRPNNSHAKQMNLPSSYSIQKMKTPLHDQTRARDNLNNTSISSSSSRSASSFYGSQNVRSPLTQRSSGLGRSKGPSLMPPPRSRLASQISFRSRDKKLFEKEVTLTGFSNLGNTCYMNAILQSLLGIPPFVQDLSNKALLDRVHPQCLYKCLYNVMLCKRKCGNAEILRNSLRKLKRTISEAATRFSGYHQHDAHEFLCQVFDQLGEDVIACNSPSSTFSSDEVDSKESDLQCPVTRTFESGVLHTVSCKQCGEITPKEEIYHAFSLDIPTLCNLSGSSPSSSVNMQTLIKKHFEDEELEYTCAKCDSKEAVISHTFIRLPRVLILHLKRYGYDNLTEEQEKKQDKVNIERFIGLEMMCSSNTKTPLPFQPKSTLQLSPVKSRQKSLKRHFVREEDDDDDFQPSPSVRRKLDDSFRSTGASRSTLNGSTLDDVELITEIHKPDTANKLNRGTYNPIESDFVESAIDNKENSLNSHLVSERLAWEASEEQQMEWALVESAKSAEKKPKDDLRRKIFNEKLEPLAAPFSKGSLQNMTDSEGFLKITQEYDGDDALNIGDKDCMENGFDDGFSDIENPVWARSEEEQVKWALAESARLSVKKKSRAVSKEDQREGEIYWTEKSGLSKASSGCDSDFTLISDLSDEDLLTAAWDSRTAGEPKGLKGGGPIATERCSGGVEDNPFLVNDENKSPPNCKDSDLDGTSSFVLRNRPIIKRKKSPIQWKCKTFNSKVLNKTPVLRKFEGNLFEDEPKENKPSAKSTLPNAGSESSWFPSSFSTFCDDDMEKAINMSLQDQECSNVEDDELKKALELSLHDFERKCPEVDQTVLPPVTTVTGTNAIDSTFQDEGSKVSTHSYRLVSIVSHLGSRSTSGHYISDVYDCKSKQWTSYDDSTATKVTEHSVRYKRQQSGYIFFYMYKQCVDAMENSQK